MADEKYQLQLTGAQVDDALEQLNQRVAEGWAVGTRDGSPVPASSQYYQNNARYYAQRAESIAPASVTEAVRWDIPQTALTDENKAQARENIDAVGSSSAVQVVEQTFTDSEKAQARANIAAGGTNPNLLDNPFFGNPVNQRGLTTYSGTGQLKTIDRWVLYNGSGTNSLTIKSGYISVRSDANGFAQLAEDAVGAALNGKTLTASILFNDGTVMSKTGVYNNSALVALGGGIYFGLVGGKQCLFDYTTGNGTTKDIKAVKLELGSVSTLANDVPPDYGTELLKCRYYFRRIQVTAAGGLGMAYASSATRADWLDYTQGTPMRPTSSPTATFGGTINLYNGSNHAVSAVYAIANGTQYNLRLDTTGLTANQALIFSAGGAAYIDISHDIL